MQGIWRYHGYEISRPWRPIAEVIISGSDNLERPLRPTPPLPEPPQSVPSVSGAGSVLESPSNGSSWMMPPLAPSSALPSGSSWTMPPAAPSGTSSGGGSWLLVWCPPSTSVRLFLHSQPPLSDAPSQSSRPSDDSWNQV